MSHWLFWISVYSCLDRDAWFSCCQGRETVVKVRALALVSAATHASSHQTGNGSDQCMPRRTTNGTPDVFSTTFWSSSTLKLFFAHLIFVVICDECLQARRMYISVKDCWGRSTSHLLKVALCNCVTASAYLQSRMPSVLWELLSTTFPIQWQWCAKNRRL